MPVGMDSGLAGITLSVIRPSKFLYEIVIENISQQASGRLPVAQRSHDIVIDRWQLQPGSRPD